VLRPALAGAALALGSLGVGCKLDLTGATCNTNDNCPVRQFCSVPEGAKQGSCQPGDRFTATLTLTTDPAILPAGGTTQAVATLMADGGPAVPDGGLVTELVDWSVDPASAAIISVSNDAGTRGLVQALALGQATLNGSMVFSGQPVASKAIVVVSNAALNRIVAVADRLQYAPGTAGSAAATGFFSDGTHADLTSLVKWSSSVPSVLTVSGASGTWGRLSALAPGHSILDATYLGFSGTTWVTVGNASLVGLTLSPLQPRGVQGQELQVVDATGVFSDGSAQPMTRSVQWSVDDQSVGYFDAPGSVVLLAPGTTPVRALASNIQAQAELDVAPVAPVQMEISPAWPDPLLLGSTTRLSAWTTHQDGTVAPDAPTWSSPDRSLGVGPAGDVTTEDAGIGTVLAMDGPVAAQASIEVTAHPAVSWLVWPPELVVPVGAQGNLSLQRTHSDGTVQDLSTTAGWRPLDLDGGVDVETGETGGTVRPRQPGTRPAVIAVVPGKGARAWVRVPDGAPTLEIVPGVSTLPMTGRTHLAAVGHWPDGTVVDVTGSASWTVTPPMLIAAGNGPSAGLMLGADAGVTTVQARFGGAVAQAQLQADPDPGSLEVWPPAATLAAGTAVPVTVTLLAGSGESIDVTSDAVWISNNPNVSIVTNAPDQPGSLLGRSAGAALIVARVGPLQASLPVSVSKATLQRVDIQPPAAVTTWAPATFRATGTLSDGSTQDLTPWVGWSASDPGILRVHGTGPGRGEARGLDAGTVQVMAHPLGGPSVTVPVSVNGTPLVSLSVELPAGPVTVGSRPRAQALAQGGDGTTVDVTGRVEWTSSAPTVATVSSVVRPGWTSALQPGTTLLGARLAGLSGSAPLQVVGDGVTALTVFAPGTLQQGTVATASATATLSGGGQQPLGEEVVWSSDNPGVLGVSNAPGARGLLLGLQPGTATLRARTRPGLAPAQATAVVTVSAPALRASSAFFPARTGK